MVFAADVTDSLAIEISSSTRGLAPRLSSGSMRDLRGRVPLGGDPAPHVAGAVGDPNSSGLRAGEKAHRLPCDKGDFLEIQKDRAVCRVTDQTLAPLGV